MAMKKIKPGIFGGNASACTIAAGAPLRLFGNLGPLPISVNAGGGEIADPRNGAKLPESFSFLIQNHITL